MFCSNCGAQVRQGAAFCAGCGYRLRENAAPAPPALGGPTPPQESPYQQQYASGAGFQTWTASPTSVQPPPHPTPAQAVVAPHQVPTAQAPQMTHEQVESMLKGTYAWPQIWAIVVLVPGMILVMSNILAIIATLLEVCVALPLFKVGSILGDALGEEDIQKFDLYIRNSLAYARRAKWIPYAVIIICLLLAIPLQGLPLITVVMAIVSLMVLRWSIKRLEILTSLSSRGLTMLGLAPIQAIPA